MKPSNPFLKLQKYFRVRKAQQKLESDDGSERERAARVLTLHAWERQDGATFQRLLEGADWFTQMGSSTVTRAITKKGHALGVFTPILERALAKPGLDMRNEVRFEIASALAIHYWKNDNWEKLEACLASPDSSVRTSAMMVARSYPIMELEGMSAEKLERAEQLLEKAFVQWQKEPRLKREDLEYAIGMDRTSVSMVLQKIAERKTELVRGKDGALLAGETIEKPDAHRGLYRQITPAQRMVHR